MEMGWAKMRHIMIIETERLVLREFVAEDWQSVLAYQRDRRYLQFYPDADRTEVETQDFIQMFLLQQAEQPRRKFQLAITIQGDDTVVGTCGIRRKPDNDWEADIGFELAPEHWGHGFATEAAQEIVNYGFSTLKVHRISSWCIADNIASARVLEKVGLHPEGRLREHQYFKNRWWDTLLFGKLRADWEDTTPS